MRHEPFYLEIALRNPDLVEIVPWISIITSLF